METTYTILENDVTVNWEYRGCSPDGYVAINVAGGSGLYDVTGAALVDSDDLTYYEEEALDPGSYPLTVVDEGTGCVLKTNYIVPELPFIAGDPVFDINECQVIVTVAGGTPEYFIASDSDGQTTNPFVIDLGDGSNISSLPARIIFSDQNGCEVSLTLNIDDVPPAILNCMGLGRFNAPIIDISSKIGQEASSTNKIELFPSPASDVLKVSILDNINNLSVLSIIDNTGKTLMTNNAFDQKQLSLDTNSIPPGIYFLQLRSEDGNPIVKRFVKN